MTLQVPVEVPAGYTLTVQGHGAYTLTHHGTIIGFITAVEGLYLVRRGPRPDASTFLGAFHGLRRAIRTLTDLGG